VCIGYSPSMVPLRKRTMDETTDNGPARHSIQPQCVVLTVAGKDTVVIELGLA
jgi:hypothetical protein